MASDKESLIGEIINDALGSLSEWRKPVVGKSIGPSYPQMAEQFNRDVQNLRQNLRKMLSMKSVEDLEFRYTKGKNNRLSFLRVPDAVEFPLVAKIKELKRREPAWFISGWHVKELELDISYWKACTSGDLIAMTLMSVGLDPRKVSYNALFERYGRTTEQDTMLRFLEDQYDAIANGLGLNPDQETADINMADFYNWAQRVNFRLDDRFRRLLREKYSDVSNNKKLTEGNQPILTPRVKPIHKSTYNFHAKLFYVLAVKHFGELNSADLGRTAKKIQTLAECQGQTPSLRPIKQLLTKGHELCSKEE